MLLQPSRMASKPRKPTHFVVELRSRRKSRLMCDFERYIRTVTAFVCLAMICIMLRLIMLNPMLPSLIFLDQRQLQATRLAP
ncbi:hypothetical protein GGQ85_004334 [Nitrobacter vulgaris]|nr:hypothetical protein [Nitrobacter vulgaris]